ncbi:MAG: dihydroorotate dehydrogenase electron transfer subunit [Anaerolineae bacterium]|nr:dihydroorotate dehydrogenase electron transfer subunit [Anaerolineae bacterium]MDW8097934.1 dihydroorotate dehydrogenase electron transfer subunit [Anaerolineae bacterium]
MNYVNNWRPDLPRAARIIQIGVENERTRTFVLDLHLAARPGQFVMVWLPGVEERPLSLIAGDPVSFTVARVGPFTTALHQLRVGDRVWVRGPYGNGFDVRGQHLLCVGGGYGVAPMLFVARQAIAASRRVTAVIGARTAAELLFTDRFAALGCAVITTTDDGSAGARGLVTDGVRRVLEQGLPDEVYACGPRPMLEAILRLCQAEGLPCQLSWENKMRCAMGICGTCEQNGWLVCREGPVQRWVPIPP